MSDTKIFMETLYNNPNESVNILFGTAFTIVEIMNKLNLAKIQQYKSENENLKKFFNYIEQAAENIVNAYELTFFKNI